jgi:hypothetical protein
MVYFTAVKPLDTVELAPVLPRSNGSRLDRIFSRYARKRGSVVECIEPEL